MTLLSLSQQPLQNESHYCTHAGGQCSPAPEGLYPEKGTMKQNKKVYDSDIIAVCGHIYVLSHLLQVLPHLGRDFVCS